MKISGGGATDKCNKALNDDVDIKIGGKSKGNNTSTSLTIHIRIPPYMMMMMMVMILAIKIKLLMGLDPSFALTQVYSKLPSEDCERLSRE